MSGFEAAPTEEAASSRGSSDTADSAWAVAEEVSRRLDGMSGEVPDKLSRLLAARREIDARETALVDAQLALLAERNLYMRRLVEIERFVHARPPSAHTDDEQTLLQLVNAVLYGDGSSQRERSAHVSTGEAELADGRPDGSSSDSLA